MKLCRCGCKTDISHRRKDCVWATEGCRKRFMRAGTPDKARTGARPPTRYQVFKRTLLGLNRVGPAVEAHDRQSAIRQAVGRRRFGGRFVAIPERMLRDYLRTGKPA